MSKNKDNGLGYYEFHLPVWKQGDDFDHCLSIEKEPHKALMALADIYEESANRCRRLASVAVETKLEMEGHVHSVQVYGDSVRCDALVKDGLLDESPFDDDEEEDEECAECALGADDDDSDPV